MAKQETKYKFGDNEIDLENYIHNLENNYSSYIDSRNWNDLQKQEFRNSYERYLQGLKDQLQNNTNRFRTDSAGSVYDSTGSLSNADTNDENDPAEFTNYYDSKGNRITSNDYQLLKENKKKKYNPFNANRQVATYMWKVGQAIRDKLSQKSTQTSSSNAFNLNKHGFLANWEKINNPAGGTFSFDPYIEKDVLDESTGLRGTTNRAAYLKEQIENYIQNIGDYDFSSSPFKDRDTYISRLKAAADNLGNGYNSEDVIALNQAGIGNDFLSNFFMTSAPKQDKSELELQAEQAQKEREQREKDKKYQEEIEANEREKYEQERANFFSDYLAENPFTTNIQQTTFPNYNYSQTVQSIMGKYPNVDLENGEQRKQIMGNYVNFPSLVSYIRGEKKALGTGADKGKDMTSQHIARNLDLAYQEGLFNDPRYLVKGQDGKYSSILGDSGFIVIPDSENYNNYSFIGYNPTTRQYKEFSMINNSDLSDQINNLLREKMAYAAYDKNLQRKKEKKEQGGVLKFQLGGQGALQEIDRYKKVREAKQKKNTEEQKKNEQTSGKVEDTLLDRSEEEKKAGKRTLADGLTWTDYLRLGSIAADLVSLGSSYVPGYGTVASGVTGAGSTIMNFIADVGEDGFQLSDLGNAGVGLGADILGMIPGFGTSGKASKIAKGLTRFAPIIFTALQSANAISEPSIRSWKKVMDRQFDKLTVDDIRNLASGITAFTSINNQVGTRLKSSAMKSATKTGDKLIEDKTGQMLRISPEKLESIQNAKTLEEANKILQSIPGYQGKELPSRFKGSWNPTRLWNHNPKVGDHYDWSKLRETQFNQSKYGLPSDAELFQASRESNLGNINLHLNVKNPYSKFTKARNKSKQKQETTTALVPVNQKPFNVRDANTIRGEQAATKQREEIAKSWRERVSKIDDTFTSGEKARRQKLGIPQESGEIITPSASQARAAIGLSKALQTIPLPNPTISNPPAIIPKQQIRVPQQTQFNYNRIREGLAKAERERLGRDIGDIRLQRSIEANPERASRLQAQEAYRNVRNAFNTYGTPQYKRPLTGAAYKAKQDMYNRLFNQRRYDVIEAFRNRELPHRQSNKKKKTSRDDRRTVKREDGGTLDLVRVRKFQNAGKFPEWYSKLYKFQNLTGWNNSLNQSLAGPSITNENAGHYRAGDLNEAYTKNNSYTSNPNLVGQDLQSYYDSSFKGKSLDDYVSAYNANAAKIRGYWDQERTYKQSGAQEHNRLFKNMFGNRSDNSNNVWNIGYDSNLEDIVGSSTWLRRMDRYEKEFDNLSDEEKKSRIHKIDLGDGNYGYVYKKANGDIAVWNQPETPATSTNPADNQATPTVTSVIQPSQGPNDDNKQNKSFFRNINPTIAYGLPRAMYADRMNRRITDLAKESVVPLLKDPFEVHRYTRSDLDAEMQGERNYANLRRLASRPITSDGSLQTATQLQAEVQGQEARTAGKEKSNQVQRQYDELAWQQEKENAANRHETAMFNRAQQWGADQDKSKYEQAYLAKKFNIWDVFGQQLEYDARTKQKENKALEDNFARSDIHNAISYAPNDYGANLTPDELTVWNKVLSGTNPSSLSSQEFNSYKLAAQKVSRVETEQLRQYYNVPNTRWSGKTPSTPQSPTISKAISAKNGAKIAVAGIEAKTADAERFQKQIKECIDRNEKAIDRLSKSLYGLIKASMIK